MVPAAAVACRVTVPVPQTEAPVVEESVGNEDMLIVIVLLVAATHDPLVTSAR
jgi:hypothetical protein